ncbi:histidine kinase [Flagellimonas aquimarina]|uniref:Histidine kinase n=1 Tax=Flagellimonas aquimarina TaxID=2201895 RepID=A0A316KW38_9FLAO|nr:2TM domain-containing protein [Allomuricauda koreensis]PWL38447.1 histidine kinase [Allomuricauda koreensis]
MENFTEHKYTRAKEKVENIKSFYSSLLSYCIVIPILAFINYRTTSFPWVIFPAFGWGIGLICHWTNAHGYNPILGKDWEERKIREFMNRDEF